MVEILSTIKWESLGAVPLGFGIDEVKSLIQLRKIVFYRRRFTARPYA